MKVITSHIGSDFDSLSSMVAASRLYEDAVLCFAGSATRNVREFLKRFGLRWMRRKVLPGREWNAPFWICTA